MSQDSASAAPKPISDTSSGFQFPRWSPIQRSEEDTTLRKLTKQYILLVEELRELEMRERELGITCPPHKAHDEQ